MTVALINLVLLMQVMLLTNSSTSVPSSVPLVDEVCPALDYNRKEEPLHAVDPETCLADAEIGLSCVFSCVHCALGPAVSRQQIPSGDTSTVGHGTGNMTVALINLVLLMQVMLLTNFSTSVPSSAPLVDEMFQALDYNRKGEPLHAVDSEMCLANAEIGLSCVFSCAHCALGPAVSRLQIPSGDTSTVGHGTGNMTVALINLVLLMQVMLLTNFSTSVPSSAPLVDEMFQALDYNRKGEPMHAVDSEMCLANAEIGLSCVFSCAHCALGPAVSRLQIPSGDTSTVRRGTGSMTGALINLVLLMQLRFPDADRGYIIPCRGASLHVKLGNELER
ncbi:uncharacterized protein [Dermacentor albipictus]|uniref:uncharacterized protein isoform X5 n=1 Tax=Dermacentor albipictus TaxID=60249 RepID=UPI0031FCAF9F